MKRATVQIDQTQSQRILLSPLFLASLAVLVLNDFYLKAQFGNFLTGKLSDLTGLFAFPLFFSAFLPRRRIAVYVSTALVFALWKMPLADAVIAFWNSHAPLQIGRTVDYGDLLALAVLPLSYIYFGVAREIELPSFKLRNVATVATVAFSIFAFTATSTVGDRTVYIADGYSIEGDYDALELEPMLRTNPSIVSIKSEVRLDDSHPDLQIDSSAPATSNGPARIKQTPTPSQRPSAVYAFEIEIAQKTCNSEKSRFRFLAEKRKNILQIEAVSLSFDCSQYGNVDNINALDKSYIEHGRAIFEEHVINFLTEHRPG